MQENSQIVPNGSSIPKNFPDSDPAARTESEVDVKLMRGPSITGIGKMLGKERAEDLLRRSNVLKDEMSLAGSRPIGEDELDR